MSGLSEWGSAGWAVLWLCFLVFVLFYTMRRDRKRIAELDRRLAQHEAAQKITQLKIHHATELLNAVREGKSDEFLAFMRHVQAMEVASAELGRGAAIPEIEAATSCMDAVGDEIRRGVTP